MWRIDGNEIVIDGWQSGIADSPHEGLADIRNLDISSTPGEIMVAFKNTPVTVPPVFNAVAYTASASTDRLTIASTTGLYNGCAIVLASNTAGGLSNSIVYYVRNLSANTFQVSIAPLSSVIDISSDGTGTLTTYQFGNQRAVSSNPTDCPVSYFIANEQQGGSLGAGVFIMDASNYLWFLSTSTGVVAANTMIFLGNIGGLGAAVVFTGTGVVAWKGWVILMGSVTNLNIMSINDFVSNGPAAEWNYNFGGVSASANSQTRVPAIVAENDVVYWSNGDAVASLLEVAGETFDPTNPTTYTVNSSALDLPSFERIESLAMYNSYLYIGSRYTNLIYPWDTISPSFTFPITCPEKVIGLMVPAAQTMYVFAGSRGNIYQCNGSSVDLYRTIPEDVTGVIDPYMTWKDANVDQNNLFFSFKAVANGDNSTQLTTVAGAWAIDITTNAFRMLNKLSVSGYSGAVSMVAPVPTLRPAGNGLYVGYVQSSTYGVDCGTSNMYDAYEPFFDSDIIPIGSYFSPTTLQDVEYKLAAPLVAGETLRFSQRSNLNTSFTAFWTSSATGQLSDISESDNASGGLGSIDWENVQWVQFRVEFASTSSSPSRVRLKEFRVR